MQEKSKELIFLAEDIVNKYILREKHRMLQKRKAEIRLLKICLLLNVAVVVLLILNNG